MAAWSTTTLFASAILAASYDISHSAYNLFELFSSSEVPFSPVSQVSALSLGSPLSFNCF